MIDVDPFTGLTSNTGITGETVEQVRKTDPTGMIGGKCDVSYYVYSSNSRNLSTGQYVVISSDLVNRPGSTSKTGRTTSADMPGKFGALEDRVRRTPTKEGFCFGTPAGIL